MLSYFIGSIFAIPTHICTAFFCYLIVKDFLICYIFLCIFGILSSLGNYIAFNKLNKHIFDKVESLNVTKNLKILAKKRPYYVSLISRCTLFCAGINDYICLLVGI